jgi:FkbM family methyltransferase
LWDLNRFDEALASHDRALAIRADDAEALNSHGNALWSLRRFDEALKSYDRALAIRPSYPEALYNRATALSELKRLDDALASYDEALGVQPRYADALYGRGAVMMLLGRLEDAVESYNQALAVRPDYPEALNNCGTALSKLGRLDEAVTMYTRVLAVRPDDAVARVNRANVLRRLGRLDDALANADRALAIQPDFAAASYNRGTVLQEMRRLDEALASYEKAIALKPDYAEALYRRGIILAALGRLEEAVAGWDQALAIRPHYAEALNSRGNALRDLNRFDEALTNYDRALELQPDNPWVLNNRGNAFLKSRRYQEALASYDRALAIRPDYVEALSNRACALDELGRPEEALASFERALAIRPDYADALYNRGNVLVELKRYGDALASYDRALVARLDYVEALSNRGCALKELGRPEEALASYDRALALRPDYADAVNNRGCALLDLRRFEEALASYDRSIELNPQHAEYHNNRSLLLLLLGSFDEGWREYEWRRGRTNWVKRQFDAPEWRSEPISGKRLLLYGEQGLGDTIQFARFARSLTLSGAQVILEVQPPLRGLLRRLEGEPIIVRQGEKLPDFDLHLPLMSMPFILGFTPVQGSPASPYLTVDPDRIELWSHRLSARGFRVGIAWQGNAKNLTDQQRSVPLKAFAPLGRIPGVQLISLQKDAGVEQLADLPPWMTVETLGPEFDAGPDAFLDAAAVMMNLDLVITCDTAVAHLAGALGRPVWILLKHVPDWRWMIDREDSPWYSTARLFRQSRAGDWDEVMTEVAAALARLAAQRRVHATAGDDGTLSAPVSFGELIDRITILRIKDERIADPSKLVNIRRELQLLTEARLHSACNKHDIGGLERELEQVNQELWDIEDRIRDREQQADFGPRFIDLARAVYKTNDRRAVVKRRINEIAGSALVEEKSYRPPPKADTEITARRSSPATASETGFNSDRAPVTALKNCRHGKMLFLARDRFIGRSLDVYGEFSEFEDEVFAQLLRAGDVVVEAGANIGAHTVPIAKLVGERGAVHAFEPQRVIFQLLSANVGLNELLHVRTYHAALGRERGTIRVPSLDYRAENNFGGLSLKLSGEGEEVPLFTLDDFSLPSLRMIKVDVEGMETEVLSGARGTIGRLRPILYVENDRHAHSEQLIRLIEELEYNMWWHTPPYFNPTNFAGASRNVFGAIVSVNLLCLPKEEAKKVVGFRPVVGPTDWWQQNDAA